jgi:hypothetical protein
MHFYLYDCFKNDNDVRDGLNYGKRFLTRLLIGRWEKTVKKIKNIFTVF